MRRVLLAIGAVLLAVFAYHFYNIVTAEKRVRGLCEQITSGMPLAELKAFAAEYDLLPPGEETGVSIMVEQKSYGRWGCVVELEDGVVRRSEYHFAD
jgi:hypothetical protein